MRAVGVVRYGRRCSEVPDRGLRCLPSTNREVRTVMAVVAMVVARVQKSILSTPVVSG